MSSAKPQMSYAGVAEALIGRDVGFLIGLVTEMVRSQQQGLADTTWLLMTYMDQLSLVVYELRRVRAPYLKEPGGGTPLAFQQALEESRHSTKLLADTQKTIEDQLRTFREYAESSRDHLIGLTRAPHLIRGVPWLSRLQQDTSVVLADGEILSTSISLRYHAGLALGVPGDAVMERSRELAAALWGACAGECVGWLKLTTAKLASYPQVRVMDTRYAEFFTSTFVDFPVEESILLSILAGRLRAALLLGRIGRNSGEGIAALAFKFRLAAIWQVATTLQALSAGTGGFRISGQRADEVRVLLASSRLSPILDDGVRRLRNVLVHYGVDPALLSTLDLGDAVLGIPQVVCHGASWNEVDAALEEGAIAMLEMLDRWRGPFEHLLHEPR